MVITYPTASEGSMWSFLTITPQIVCRCRGSIMPKVLPQVLIAVGLTVLARFHNPIDDGSKTQAGVTVLGVLLSFLMVFKTQTSYNQWWEAMGHVETILCVTRSLGMATCTMLPWHGTTVRPEMRELALKKPVVFFARKVVRFLVLYYFVLVEYFQRSGSNQTRDPKRMDQLRTDIAKLTGPAEYRMLYNGEDQEVSGSKSECKHTRPVLILYWIQLAICRCGEVHGLEAPKYGIFEAKIYQLLVCFWDMNKIDKIQFPLPYSQVLKVTCFCFICIMAFILQKQLGFLSEVVVALITLGFYGLDEVAEILEAPFGNDPNCIDLKTYGFALLSDLEMMFYARDAQLDSVFGDDHELCFADLVDACEDLKHLRSKYSQRLQRSSRTLLSEIPSDRSMLPGAVSDITPSSFRKTSLTHNSSARSLFSGFRNPSNMDQVSKNEVTAVNL